MKKKSKAKDTGGMPPFVLERKENKNILVYLLITTERSRGKISQKTLELWTYKACGESRLMS